MSRVPTRLLGALAMVVAWASLADALTVLTVGKTGVFRSRRGVPSALVRIGKDPAFTTLADPTVVAKLKEQYEEE